MSEQTYILKYTVHTMTAILSPTAEPNIQYDLHVTTAEDASVQKVAKGWRTGKKDEDCSFVFEVDGNPDTRVTMPYSLARQAAQEAQEKHSARLQK